MKHKIAALACGMSLAMTAAVPASAGFFFEGLQPYVGDYCKDADPTVTDPPVRAQNFDWERSSPDASTMANRRAYEAVGCVSGKTGSHAPGRYIKPTPKEPYKVPQK